jgi:hypothetical protein
MIISFASLQSQLDLIRRGKVKTGYEFGHHRIDTHFVFKKADLNIVLGHANVGKTTVVLFLMVLQSLKNNMVWLVYSSENTASSIATKISEFYLGKVLQGSTQEELQSAMNFMQRYFVIIDAEQKMYTYNDLIEEATDLHIQHEFDGFMIDPYNSLAKDKEMYKSLGGHEYDYEVLTHFRNWCKDRQVSIWLCVHAVTEALRKKHPASHEYAGLPIPPSMSDVEGGGKHSNRSDSMLIIHRYVAHPTEWMYSHIHVAKIKEIETGGKPTSKDEPIRLRSLPSNVGFEIDGQNLIMKKETKQSNCPF